MSAAIGIIAGIKKYPIKLNQIEGELVKEEFVFDKKIVNEQSEIKNIEFQYLKKIDNENYVLIEEYMFKDMETVLDTKRAIGINYYLYKKEKPLKEGDGN